MYALVEISLALLVLGCIALSVLYLNLNEGDDEEDK